MISPYHGDTLFSFFLTLARRGWHLLTGRFSGIAPDELQIAVLLAVACSAALVGTFLLYRRMAMLANSLSHSLLLGLVLAVVLTLPTAHMISYPNVQTMLLAGLITGVATAFLTQVVTSHLRLPEEAATGLVFTTLFALGLIFATAFTRNSHIGPEIIMGNVDALLPTDCVLVYLVLAINLFAVALCYKELATTTFDRQFASTIGLPCTTMDYLLMLLTSITVVGAFRAVGVVMVLAFLTVPPLTASMLVRRLSHLLLLAMGISCGIALFGVALSRHILSVYALPLSTGGLIVTLMGVWLLLVCIFKAVTGRGAHAAQQQLANHTFAPPSTPLQQGSSQE